MANARKINVYSIKQSKIKRSKKVPSAKSPIINAAITQAICPIFLFLQSWMSQNDFSYHFKFIWTKIRFFG